MAAKMIKFENGTLTVNVTVVGKRIATERDVTVTAQSVAAIITRSAKLEYHIDQRTLSQGSAGYTAGTHLTVTYTGEFNGKVRTLGYAFWDVLNKRWNVTLNGESVKIDSTSRDGVGIMPQMMTAILLPYKEANIEIKKALRKAKKQSSPVTTPVIPVSGWMPA